MAEISLETFDMPGGGPGADETRIGGTVWVSSLGNDATGERNNLTRHFLTIPAAVAAAQAGDVVMIAPGAYTVSGNIAKDDLVYQTLGVASITYTGTDFLFDTSGLNAGITIDGDFVLINQAGSSGVININDDSTRNIRFLTIECYAGYGIRIVGALTTNPVTIRGNIFSSEADGALLIDKSGAKILYYGSVTSEESNSYPVQIRGSQSVFLLNGDFVHELGIPTMRVGEVKDLVVNGAIRSTYAYTPTPALTIYENGGRIVVNGSVEGGVSDTTNNVNVQFENTFTLNGNLYGKYIGQGYCKATLNGEIVNSVVLDSADSAVTVNGPFTRLLWAAFEVYFGKLVINGPLLRTGNLFPSTISGGEVYLNADWSARVDPYGEVSFGMIRMTGGTLRLGGAFTNTSTDPRAAIVEIASGESVLILHGASLKTDSCVPINAPLLNVPAAIRVYGGVCNINYTPLQAQVREFTVTAATVGQDYVIDINGSAYAPYTAIGGDTPTTIAAAIAALITDPNVTVGAAGPVVTVTANVAGTPFTSATTGPIDTYNSVLNYPGINNLIAGTDLIQDSDVL